MRQKLLSFVAASFLALSVPVAAQSLALPRAEPGAVSGGTLRVAVDRLTSYNLIPHDNTWIGTFLNQFEALVRVDDKGQFHPWLAKSWDISDDGKVYTFKLRDDVVFQDGDKFNAQAVKFNFDSLYESKLQRIQSYKASLLYHYKEARVLDDYTVRIELAKPDASFLTRIGTLVGAIVSPSSIKALKPENLGDSLKGTGPFELVRFIPDQRLVYKRFDKYNWAAADAKHNGPAYLDSLVIDYVPDAAVRAGLLSSGQVDFVTAVGLNDIPLFQDNADFQFISRPDNSVPWTWYFNVNGFATNDIRVREAFREALDLGALVSGIYQSTGKRAWSQIASGSTYYNKGIEGTYSNNVERANALLDEAGWTGRNAEGIRTNDKGQALELVLLDRGLFGRNKLFGEAAQQVLRENAGIKLTFDTVDMAQGFAKRSENKYSLFHTQIGGYDLGESLINLFSSHGVMNFAKVSDRVLTVLMHERAGEGWRM
ncbi:ABC transporter substrate-binding protein (plasmid) [Microvirga sp. RSM25]|uniref:ABC transporter substrate-binding protein n=1 Tax=Microvirga sp. RSM25 TaxID=3273802 RepID=UPI00384DB8AF